MKKWLAIALLLVPSICMAQAYQTGFVYRGNLAGIPATCIPGQLAFILDVTAGQQIYECSAANVWTQQDQDPIVSGPDSIGAVPTRNPIFFSTWDGTNIRVPLTTNTTPGGSDYALEVRTIGSQAVTCTAANCLFNLTQVASTSLGTPVAYGSTPTGNAVSVNAFITNTVPVTGTFYQATQPVSCATGATCPVNATLSAETTKVIGTVNQGTSPWVVSGSFFQATQPISIASGQVASGAYASGSISDGAEVTIGAKADAKNAATDTTAISAISILKEISSLEQAPASRAVTNVGTFATQSAITAASGALASGSIASGACASGCIADGGMVTIGAKADAKNAATDTTAVSVVSVLKEISSLEQAPASRAVTNAGTFEVQPDGTTATTTNAASRCTLISAASTNATNCKNGSGNVYGYRFVNTTATLYYLRMYNLTTAPTCSSATGFVETIPIPASATGAGIVSIEPMGEGYSTGIGFCFTGGSSSTDNTNAATGVFGTILYR